jgi:hypothetical protein
LLCEEGPAAGGLTARQVLPLLPLLLLPRLEFLQRL